MTYSVIVAAEKNKSVVVKVDAVNVNAAKDIARWLVAHHQHLQAHAVVVEAPKQA
jgi:hypothetical protein